MSAHPAGHGSEQPGLDTPSSPQPELPPSSQLLAEFDAIIAGAWNSLDNTEHAFPTAVDPRLLDRRSAPDGTDSEQFSLDEFLANLENPVPYEYGFDADNLQTLPAPYEVAPAQVSAVTPPFSTPHLFSEAPVLDNAYFQQLPEPAFAFDTSDVPLFNPAIPPVDDAWSALYGRANAPPQQAPPPPALLPVPTTQYDGPPAAPVDQRPQGTEGWPIFPAVRRIHEATQSFMELHRSNPPSREASLTEILPTRAPSVPAKHPEGPLAAPGNPYSQMPGGSRAPAQDYGMPLWDNMQEVEGIHDNMLPQFPVPDIPAFLPYASHQYAGANEFIDNTVPFQAVGLQAGGGALVSAQAFNDAVSPPLPPLPFASTYPAGYMPGMVPGAQAFQDAPLPVSPNYIGQPWKHEQPMQGTLDTIAAILPPAQPDRVFVRSIDNDNTVPVSHVASDPIPSSHKVPSTPPISAKRLGKMKEEPITPAAFTPASTSDGPGPDRTKKERASYSPYHRKEAKPSPSGSDVPIVKQSPSPFTHVGTLDFRTPKQLNFRNMTPDDFGLKGRLPSTPIRYFGGEDAPSLLSPVKYAGAQWPAASAAMKPDPDAHDPSLTFADEASGPPVTEPQNLTQCPVTGCKTKALLHRVDALVRHLRTFHPKYVLALEDAYAELPERHPLKHMKGRRTPLGTMLIKEAKEERDKVPLVD